MRSPDVNYDNKEIDFLVMEDVTDDLIRHDPFPLVEDPLINVEASLPDNPATGEDMDCSQQSLGSMGLRVDSEGSDEKIQVLLLGHIKCFKSIALYLKVLSLNSSNLLQRNHSNVILLRIALYPG